MNLKNRLRDIETDCRDGFHDLAPPNRRGLNSTHIRGTHVPVEEPSTASIGDERPGMRNPVLRLISIVRPPVRKTLANSRAVSTVSLAIACRGLPHDFFELRRRRRSSASCP
jgi:hypothetical protein